MHRISRMMVTGGLTLALAAGVAFGVGQAQGPPVPTQPTEQAEPTPAPAQGGVFYRVEMMRVAPFEYKIIGAPSHAVFCESGKMTSTLLYRTLPSRSRYNNEPAGRQAARADAAQQKAEFEAGASACYAIGEPGEIVIAGRYLGRITAEAYTLPDAFPVLTDTHTTDHNTVVVDWSFVGPRIVPATELR